MCLITYTPRKETIDYDKMKTAMHVNPHGFGIVFAYEGVLRYCRKPKEGFDYFVEAMKLVPDDAPVAIHFRMATHGDKGEDNQHPFPILTKDEHGIDLCMMHNGVISGIHKNGSNKSDTLIYAEHILSPLLIKHPDLVSDAAFKLLVERDIGSGNKLLFMDGDGNVEIYNAESGSFDKKHEDMWYSNTYSFNEYHRGGGGYNSNFTGKHQHQGGGHGGVGGNYSEHWKNRQHNHSAATNNTNTATTSGGTVVDLPPVKMTPVELALKLGSDFMLELNPPLRISCLLKEGEHLVRKVDEKSLSTSMGFGWVTRGDDYFYWNAQVSSLHRAWARERDEAKNVDKVVSLNPPVSSSTDVTPSKEELQLTPEQQLTHDMEIKFGKEQLRQLNDAETMQWVIDHPEQAAKYLLSNGWYGSVPSLTKWLNDATTPSIDMASEFIYKNSRGLKASVNTQGQMSLAV